MQPVLDFSDAKRHSRRYFQSTTDSFHWKCENADNNQSRTEILQLNRMVLQSPSMTFCFFSLNILVLNICCCHINSWFWCTEIKALSTNPNKVGPTVALFGPLTLSIANVWHSNWSETEMPVNVTLKQAYFYQLCLLCSCSTVQWNV